MSFGQEVKDFASAFKSTSGAMESMSRKKYYDALSDKSDNKETSPDMAGFAQFAKDNEGATADDYLATHKKKARHSPIHNIGHMLGLNTDERDDTAPVPGGPVAPGQQFMLRPNDTSGMSDDTPDANMDGYSRGGAVRSRVVQRFAIGGPVAEDPENPAPAASAAPTQVATADHAPARAALPDTPDAEDAPSPAAKAPAQEADPENPDAPPPDALHAGLTQLQKNFGLDRPAPAVGQDHERMAGQKALMNGIGRPSERDMDEAADAVGIPDRHIKTAEANLRVMDYGYKWYLMHGEVDKANNFAASILQYATHQAAAYGTAALDDLRRGDIHGAADKVATGYNAIPNGKKAEQTVLANGTIDAKVIDVDSGKVVSEHTITPQQLYQGALSLSNKSGAWQTIIEAAAERRGLTKAPASKEMTDADKDLISSAAGVNEDGSPRKPAAGFDPKKAPGMVKPGNLDPWNRKVLQNPDGSYSTTSSISIGTDDGEVLIPTVVDGKRLSQQEAIEHFKKTGENFGTFKSSKEADDFATSLHEAQASKYDAHGNPVTSQGNDDVASAINKLPEYQRGYAAVMAQKEASNDPSAVNRKNPGSAGLFQFTPDTWKYATGQTIDPKLIGTKDDPRLNAGKSTDAMRQLTAKNETTFRKAFHRDPQPAELAVMHQQGSTGGLELMRANPDEPASKFVSEKALRQNAIDPKATAGQAVAAIKKYYFGKDGSAPKSSDPMTVLPMEEKQDDAPTMATPAEPEWMHPDAEKLAKASPEARKEYFALLREQNGRLMQEWNKSIAQAKADHSTAMTNWTADQKAARAEVMKPVPTQLRSEVNDKMKAAEDTDEVKELFPDAKTTKPVAGMPKLADVRPIAFQLFSRNPDMVESQAYQLALQLADPTSKSFKIHATPSGMFKIKTKMGDYNVTPNGLAVIKAKRESLMKLMAAKDPNASSFSDTPGAAAKAGVGVKNIARNGYNYVMSGDMGRDQGAAATAAIKGVGPLASKALDYATSGMSDPFLTKDNRRRALE